MGEYDGKRIVGRKPSRKNRMPYSKGITRSFMLGDNEGYAAEIADQAFKPEPQLIAAVKASSFYDEDELFPWELLGHKTRGRNQLSPMLRPSVIQWIEAQAKEKPIAHALYNKGRRSHLLAEHALRAMLGIRWTQAVQNRWFRYRMWRIKHEQERLLLMASTGLMPVQDYVEAVLKNFDHDDST